MSNTLITNDVIANRSLAVMHEKCTFLGTVYRDYDEEFGKAGSKVGDTIRIRKPNQYTRRQGSRIMSVQDQAESNLSLTVSYQDGVDLRFNSAERALSIDKFTERYIDPAISGLISGIESDVLQALTKQVYNCVGSAGTVPGASSDTTVFGNARARLNRCLAPKDMNRNVQIDSETMASVVNANKALFHDDPQIKEAFREGYYKRGAGADWYENERVLSLTNGSDVTGTTDVAAGVTDGGTTLSADTASPVTYTVGMVFTIAGVYSAHPETKASLGYLQQFTNTAGTGSGGDMTISPATFLTGAKQNVCKSTGAALATTDFDSQTLTAVGSASAAYRYGLMYHRDAFAFATADLPLKGDAAKCVRKSLDGLSIRVWEGSDIRNDEDLVRLDILYGYLALYPQWATRIVCT